MKRGALVLAVATGALLGCDGGTEKRRHDPPEGETSAPPREAAPAPKPELVVRVDLAAIRIEGGPEPEFVEATRDAAARARAATAIPKLAARLSPSSALVARVDPDVSMAALQSIANTARAAGLSELELRPFDAASVHALDLTLDPDRKGKHVTLDRVPGAALCDTMRDDPVAPMRRPVFVHVRLSDDAPVRDLLTILGMASRCAIPEVHVALAPGRG